MWLAIALTIMLQLGHMPTHPAGHDGTVWKLLRALPGPNLEQLPSRDQARIALEYGGAQPRAGDRWQPWRFWKLPATDRYLLLVRSQLLVIPGESRIRAFVLSEKGAVLSLTEFSTGWRNAQVDAAVSTRAGIGTFFTIRCVGCWYCRQHYGISGDRLYLLRLEGEDGLLVRNPYVAPNFIVGPEILLSPGEAARNLEGRDIVLRLATLAWLGAKHLDLEKSVDEMKAGIVSSHPGTTKQANAVRAARLSPRVRNAIAKLRKSSDPWVRESALAVQKIGDGDTSFGNVDDPPCTCPRAKP